ncbi:SDR family oxidoreductase [Jeotgalibacillus campisalis]|uniref:Short-chain dehydrogenase/reductase SDR n=1 Tax=Jeotgalibacillus campisalis TaxID=220754 RepID=A0A0C2RXF4_9BACL|nr:SDR family oxidoreductase [Jeotgalibacillus campisalis]KIL46419.1 short-chain dehydrogenase/reductase SDR [Jeotgalibacillus campisalis]
MTNQQPSRQYEEIPVQQQHQKPGKESEMEPRPVFRGKSYQPSGKLAGKTAIITGGDSGIGRSVAIHFAKEGADVVIAYLDEHDDAQETKALIEEENRQCLILAGDIGREAFCQEIVQKTIAEFGKIDILVNNAGEQHPQESLEDITEEQLERTFRTNVFSYFFLTKAALPHLKAGSSIITTASITGYAGKEILLDYSATNGARTSFMRSLSQSVAKKGIRVNGVAPGPIWTPLIPSTFGEEDIESFGDETPLGRPGQPEELAPAYVYLASDDSSYVSGQMIHVNGGMVVNG